MVYATLYTSRIYGVNPLPDLNIVNTTIANDENANAGLFVVPILYADYNYLRPDAIDAHLLSVTNNQIYDVAGRTQSPYASANVFAASPSLGYADTGTPSFIFKSDLFYKASAKTLNYINIDFGDGRGYLAATIDSPITAAYSAVGIYQIKIKILFTDNSSVECYSPFRVTQINQATYQAQLYQQSSGCLVNKSFAATGNHSGGTAWIRYASSHYSGCKIAKPLIVAKGYDLSDAGKSLGLHYGFQNFLVDLSNGPSPYLLSDNLNFAGYDIIFLDYNTSMDDITRNAALLQDVIDWVNTQKAAAGSTEKNVVMGISMGGLVARYCLANMTKQGKDPQTRLLLTDDSPHQGANLPLGLQALTRAFSETALARLNAGVTFTFTLGTVVPAYVQAVNALDATSSRQMLILHADDGHGGYSTNTFLNSTYRNMITFLPTDPQPAYKVEAMSLGSECGVSSLSTSANLLQVSGNFFLSPIPWLSKQATNTYAVAKALPVYGASQNIMQFHIWTSYTILSIITINVDITNKSASSPANTLPWDGAPGGILKVKDQFAANIPTTHNSWGPFFNWTQAVTGTDAFCFVPTVSALDIATINATALAASYVGGVNPTNAARVNNFIAEGKFDDPNGNLYNAPHALLTPRNAEWLFDEIQGIANTMNCSQDCVTSYAGLLTGPSLLCSSGSFFVNNLPSGSTVTWSSDNINGLTMSPTSTTTGPVTATRINGFNGQITVNATIKGSCSNSSTSQASIYVGAPLATTNTLTYVSGKRGVNPISLSPGATYTFQCDALQAATSYYWALPSGFSFLSPSGHDKQSVYITTSATGGSYRLSASGNNQCGSSWAQSLSISISSGGSGGGGGGGGGGILLVVAHPNPASKNLNVQFDEITSEDKGTLDGQYRLLLLDRTSQIIYSIESSEKSIQIPLDGIPTGIYYLNAFYKDSVVKEKIVVVK